MKRIVLLLSIGLFLGCSPQQMEGVLGSMPGTPLSNADVIAGLKEALRLGAEHSVASAGAQNGFWNNALIRIPFPPEAIQVRNTLLDLGIRKPVEDFERTMNTAAEKAAQEAVPVFVEAITSMTIQDGFTILRGGENAATNYLRERTSTALRARFRPIVEQATSEVALTSYWHPLASTYNTATLITGGQAVEPDLDAYVTTKAMDGLFLLIAQEEKKIRTDPLARTTDLLRRVFAAQ